jgi:hypothetical protein
MKARPSKVFHLFIQITIAHILEAYNSAMFNSKDINSETSVDIKGITHMVLLMYD